MKIYCCGCQKETNAKIVKGDVIYPHRKDLYNKSFYKCPVCNNYVGCHPNTEVPLGNIPTFELKKQRIKVHDIMDAL